MSTTRHPQVDHITGMLARILHGRAAEAALEQVRTAPVAPAPAVFVLPKWGWVVSRIDVGRKDRIPGSDERLLLPVRLTWQPSGVVVTTKPVQAHFAAKGMGHTNTGSVLLDPAAETGTWELPDGTLDPSEVWGPVARGKQAAISHLTGLVEDGRLAYWEVLSVLEEKVEWALHRATTTATTDMGQRAEGARALDDISLETLRSTMVYGNEEQQAPSPIQRLVEKCTSPATFVRVDPERYLSAAVRRDARQEVRKAIGDPRIGSKIRAVAAELGPVGIDEIVAEYRKRYPCERLSSSRALAALSLRPHPNASTVPLNEEAMAPGGRQAA